MKKSYGDQNGRNPSSSSKHEAVRARLAAQQHSEQPDWGRIEDRLLWTVIQRVTPDDGAIMFGYSRDGGAYSIRIYGAGDPYTSYFHRDDEVTTFLIQLAEEYSG